MNDREELEKLLYAEVTSFKAVDYEDLVNKIMAWHTAKLNEARIDELKLITKDTFDKPITPENQENDTWQGGYRFAKNSLKRYKLERIAQLQGGKESDE